MRVLVCGGRDYRDGRRVFAELGAIVNKHRAITVIEGGATGADRHARAWARAAGYAYETFEADWNRFGTAAGPMRNQRMITEGKPDMVLSFPGGKGTADMLRRARAAGIEVREIPEGDRP